MHIESSISSRKSIANESNDVILHSQHSNSIKQDSEVPTEVFQEASDQEIKFVLCAERYLVGHDIRGVVELDKNRFGVVTWNENKVY